MMEQPDKSNGLVAEKIGPPIDIHTLPPVPGKVAHLRSQMDLKLALSSKLGSQMDQNWNSGRFLASKPKAESWNLGHGGSQRRIAELGHHSGVWELFGLSIESRVQLATNGWNTRTKLS